MLELKDKVKCCGCTACFNICPKQAIEMIEDDEGFKYPKIDIDKCSKCGLCKKVCPMLDSGSNLEFDKLIYAVKHKNNDIRKCSSSGGAFTAVSDYFLENDGIVYGVIYNKKLEVIHSRITSKKERDMARGSKYVQSDLKDIFKQVKKDLLEKKEVLFVGTPCQTYGLKKYLFKEYENLYLCDIVCHGVPSPKIFKDYVSYLKNKLDNKLNNLKFRDKDISWRGANVSIETKKGKIINSPLIKSFSNLYFSHYIIRPSCHSCPFTSTKRKTDITIGDFWGIEKNMKYFEDSLGVSLVMINSKKGEKLYERIKQNMIIEKIENDDYIQPQLQYPTKINKNREKLWNDYKKYGFEYIIKKYTSYGLKRRILYIGKQFLLKIISHRK